LSIPKAVTAQHALALEAHTFQRTLLGHVADFGLCLQAVDRRGREQVADQLSLRLGAKPPPAMPRMHRSGLADDTRTTRKELERLKQILA
jgi:hypothetical protein